MPIHDWTRVEAGIFHDFHHEWISQIKHSLNDGRLPDDYYAMAEQQAAGFGPDVLTLQTQNPDPDAPVIGAPSDTATLIRPTARFMAQTDAEFYRRKKSSVVVRHVSDDRVVAILEVVSPGKKARRNPFRALIEKALVLLEHKIHLLLIDLFPSTRRDPHGLHAAIWAELVEDSNFLPPPGKSLTLVSYDSDLVVKAYVESVAVGDVLPTMPLILEPDGAVLIPMEDTYQAAWKEVPRRWRTVLERSAT